MTIIIVYGYYSPLRSSVSQPNTSRVTLDGKVAERHIPYRINSVVVLVFGLVRLVAVAVFRPLIRTQVADDTLRTPCYMQAVTLQYIDTAHNAVVTLDARADPKP